MKEKLAELRKLIPDECIIHERKSEIVIEQGGIFYALGLKLFERQEVSGVAARYNQWWENRSRAAAELNI